MGVSVQFPVRLTLYPTPHLHHVFLACVASRSPCHGIDQDYFSRSALHPAMPPRQSTTFARSHTPIPRYFRKLLPWLDFERTLFLMLPRSPSHNFYCRPFTLHRPRGGFIVDIGPDRRWRSLGIRTSLVQTLCRAGMLCLRAKHYNRSSALVHPFILDDVV
jgi:hypothetical protein